MDISFIEKDDLFIIKSIIYSLFNVITLILIAFAWAGILVAIDKRRSSYFSIAYFYIISNIAKYLPGNVMNLIGRNILAGRIGYKQKDTALSTMIEMFMLAGTTFFLSILFLFNKIKVVINYIYINISLLTIIILTSIIIFPVVIVVYYSIYKRKELIKRINFFLSKNFLCLIIKISFIYVLHFLLSGLVALLVLKYILFIELSLSVVFFVIGAYALSYFAGYITPGSPAGIGVRETVLILLLSSVIQKEKAVMVALIHRLITVFSDCLVWIIFILIKRTRYGDLLCSQ